MSLFRRIMGRKPSTTPDRAATAPLDPSTLEGYQQAEMRRHLTVGAAHSAGLERSEDDDALLVLTGESDGHDGLLDFGLFCVADGLGGYAKGNVASAVAVRTVAHKLTEGAFLRLLSHETEEEDQSLEELVGEAFDDANAAVVDQAEGGATTLTAALLLGERLMIGHVGDTRAYFIGIDQVEILTPDHSVVHEMIRTGAMTEDEARESPHRSVLWNAMGKAENLQVDVFSRHVPHGSYLLLCSDGLWGAVPDEAIQSIVLEQASPQDACDRLIQAANDAGGKDNITAVLVKFPEDK